MTSTAVLQTALLRPGRASSAAHAARSELTQRNDDLQNAVSIAKNILVTEAIVAEPQEKVGAGMADLGGMM